MLLVLLRFDSFVLTAEIYWKLRWFWEARVRVVDMLLVEMLCFFTLSAASVYSSCFSSCPMKLIFIFDKCCFLLLYLLYY